MTENSNTDLRRQRLEEVAENHRSLQRRMNKPRPIKVGVREIIVLIVLFLSVTAMSTLAMGAFL